MAGSKRFKFQGSEIAVIVDFHGDSPSSPILGITKANPAVVSETAHGRVSGDVIRIQGVLGMTEVNNEIYIVERINANSYSLVDTNSTDYGTWTSSGIVDGAKFSNFCELTGYNRSGGSKPEIDATSLCSTATEYELGLPNFGTTQIDYHFAPQTAIQKAIIAFEASGGKLGVKVTLPKSGGNRVLLGFIQQTSEKVSLNGLWTGSVTLRNTGSPYDYV